MVDEQNFALADGTVGLHPSWNAPSPMEQKAVLERGFRGFTGKSYSWIDDSSKIKEVKLSDAEESIKFAMRSVSGGGRASARPDELRIQIDPETINELFSINSRGGIGLIIGIYRVDKATALVLWRPLDGSTGSGSSSKQIDAHVIARAMDDGVSSYVYPDGEIVYAIKPELFRSYIDCLMPESKHAPVESLAISGEIGMPRNLIYFGAPGTGKSYQLNEDALGGNGIPAKFISANTSRVTFHPDYTYAQFVGCYKPYTDVDGDGKTRTGYRFMPGPFLDIYAQAKLHPDQNFLLIIEELNRANPAAVFGDIFQLLDRMDDGLSRYEVDTPFDMKECLENYPMALLSNEERQNLGEDYLKKYESKLALPPNLYIWATMNSADQGVFPMDTAFKRRWDFCYIGIDEKESQIPANQIILGRDKHVTTWNALRKGINKVLLDNRINEDKLLGPFFINPSTIGNPDTFSEVFKSKVLLYLFEDAAKTKKEKVFSSGAVTYATICLDFDEKGEGVFNNYPSIDYQDTKNENNADLMSPEA